MSRDDVARTLDAFLTEHERCWRYSGEDMETWDHRPLVRVACPGCGAVSYSIEEAGPEP